MKQNPNTVLPDGAKLLTPEITKNTGGWVEMTYDASVERLGVTWLRAKGGFGSNHPREDWVADLPEICVSVHDYHWNGEDFGPSYGSFDEACRQELISATQRCRDDLAEKQDQVSRLEQALAMVESVVQKEGAPV